MPRASSLLLMFFVVGLGCALHTELLAGSSSGSIAAADDPKREFAPVLGASLLLVPRADSGESSARI